MTDTVRFRVIEALSDALRTISPANGYATDLADTASGVNRVVRGRLTLSEVDPDPPLLAINEKPVFPEAMNAMEDSGGSKEKLELLIQGFAPNDVVNPTDPAYPFMGDVKRLLTIEKKRDRGFNILNMGNTIESLHFGQGVVRPPDGVVSDTAFFWLPVTLSYVEDLS